MFGFFSIMIEICSVLGRLLTTPTGTTAPFSAISGAVIWTSALSTGLPAPMADIAVSSVLASKALLFQAASASSGLIRPAAASRPSTPRPPPAFRVSLR
jgi:phosphate/sulfate permease